MSLERIDPKQNLISYDTFLHMYRYEIVRKYAQDPLGQPALLDCACGDGYGAELLKGCTSYTGVDVSSEAVNYARENYGEYGEFCLCDGPCLPFSDGAFELISSLETIEHLPKNEHFNFVRELVRVLRRGGKIIISTPNKSYLYKKYLRFKKWSNPYHKYEYNIGEFISFIRSFPNVTIKKAYVIGFPIPLPMNFLYLDRLPYYMARYIAYGWISLGVCCRGLSNSIVVVAEKK